VKNFRAEENGAELVTKSEQARTRILRVPFDRDFNRLRDDEVYLRIWSPVFFKLDRATPVEVTIKKNHRSFTAPGQNDSRTVKVASRLCMIFDQPVAFPDGAANERIYALPADLILEPQTEYKISGTIRAQNKTTRLFGFNFHTDSQGRPAAY